MYRSGYQVLQIRGRVALCLGSKGGDIEIAALVYILCGSQTVFNHMGYDLYEVNSQLIRGQVRTYVATSVSVWRLNIDDLPEQMR